MDSNVLSYIVAALGAVTVYLLLPGERSQPEPTSDRPEAEKPSLLLGATLYEWGIRLINAAALLGLMAVVAQPSMGPRAPDLLAAVFGGSALASAVLMITQERPVYAALWFVMVILSVAGLLLLLGAQFLAAVLVVVYAGAILVTYLFVIMLAVKAGMPEYDTRSYQPAGGCAAGLLMVLAVWMAILGKGGYDFKPPAPPGEPTPTVATVATVASRAAAERVHDQYIANHTRSLGQRIFRHHFVALQAAAVLLLVALAGAVALSNRRVL